MRVIRISRPAFFTDAACRGQDPDEWVPDPSSKKSTQRQKAICAGCPVLTECHTYALADDQLVGIWGGTSEIERDRLRSKL